MGVDDLTLLSARNKDRVFTFLSDPVTLASCSRDFDLIGFPFLELRTRLLGWGGLFRDGSEGATGLTPEHLGAIFRHEIRIRQATLRAPDVLRDETPDCGIEILDTERAIISSATFFELPVRTEFALDMPVDEVNVTREG